MLPQTCPHRPPAAPPHTLGKAASASGSEPVPGDMCLQPHGLLFLLLLLLASQGKANQKLHQSTFPWDGKHSRNPTL